MNLKKLPMAMVALTLISCSFLTSCDEETTTESANTNEASTTETKTEVSMSDDILNYSKKIVPLIEIETAARKKYNDSLDAGDADKTLKVIDEHTLPEFQKFLDGLNTIKPATPELKAILEKVVLSTEQRMIAFGDVASALEKKDQKLVNAAFTKLKEAQKPLAEANATFAKLKEANGFK